MLYVSTIHYFGHECDKMFESFKYEVYPLG